MDMEVRATGSGFGEDGMSVVSVEVVPDTRYDWLIIPSAIISISNFTDVIKIGILRGTAAY